MNNHTIIGGGNIGTLLLAEFANKGYMPSVHTSDPKRWGDTIEVYDHHDSLCYSTSGFTVTNDLKEAVSKADMIWITYPASMFEDIADKLYPLISPQQTLVILPGAGGAEFAFREVIKKGCSIIGFERVHSISRLKSYGHAVSMLGRKASLNIGSIPASRASEFAPVIEELFDMPCSYYENYLNVTLVPSNPILHTTRLYSMFKDYTPGKEYEKNPFFYREWDDSSSEMLISCDQELQTLCKAFSKLNLKGVKSLCEHYESYTVDSMTKKISTITAFKDLVSPLKKTETGWIPDFSSRYFKSDFSYGLKIIKDIAGLTSVPISNINRIWDWYITTTGDTEYFSLEDMDLEDFYRIYQ